MQVLRNELTICIYLINDWLEKTKVYSASNSSNDKFHISSPSNLIMKDLKDSCMKVRLENDVHAGYGTCDLSHAVRVLKNVAVLSLR